MGGFLFEREEGRFLIFDFLFFIWYFQNLSKDDFLFASSLLGLCMVYQTLIFILTEVAYPFQ